MRETYSGSQPELRLPSTCHGLPVALKWGHVPEDSPHRNDVNQGLLTA